MSGLNSDVRLLKPADFINRNKYCQVEIYFADEVEDVSVTVHKDTGTVPRDAILIQTYTYCKFDRSAFTSDALSKLKTTASVVSFVYQFKTLDAVNFNIEYKNKNDDPQTTKYIWFPITNEYVAANHNYNGVNQEELDDYY